jgi:hypothetical protein
MKVRIEIEASTTMQLSSYLARLAAHVLRSSDLKPIKILGDDGAVATDLTIPAAKQ